MAVFDAALMRVPYSAVGRERFNKRDCATNRRPNINRDCAQARIKRRQIRVRQLREGARGTAIRVRVVTPPSYPADMLDSGHAPSTLNVGVDGRGDGRLQLERQAGATYGSGQADCLQERISHQLMSISYHASPCRADVG